MHFFRWTRTARIRAERFISIVSPVQRTAIRCLPTSRMTRSTRQQPQHLILYLTMPAEQKKAKHWNNSYSQLLIFIYYFTAHISQHKTSGVSGTLKSGNSAFVFTVFYFCVVLPKPPLRMPCASSSTVIPYSTKIPCINPVPA